MQRRTPGAALLLCLSRLAQLVSSRYEYQASLAELSDLILIRGEHAHGLVAHRPLDPELAVDLHYLADAPVVALQRVRQAFPHEVAVASASEEYPPEHDPSVARCHHVGDDVAERVQGAQLGVGDPLGAVEPALAIPPALVPHELDDQLAGDGESEVLWCSPVGYQVAGREELLGAEGAVLVRPHAVLDPPREFGVSLLSGLVSQILDALEQVGTHEAFLQLGVQEHVLDVTGAEEPAHAEAGEVSVLEYLVSRPPQHAQRQQLEEAGLVHQGYSLLVRLGLVPDLLDTLPSGILPEAPEGVDDPGERHLHAQVEAQLAAEREIGPGVAHDVVVGQVVEVVEHLLLVVPVSRSLVPVVHRSSPGWLSIQFGAGACPPHLGWISRRDRCAVSIFVVDAYGHLATSTVIHLFAAHEISSFR